MIVSRHQLRTVLTKQTWARLHVPIRSIAGFIRDLECARGCSLPVCDRMRTCAACGSANHTGRSRSLPAQLPRSHRSRGIHRSDRSGEDD